MRPEDRWDLVCLIRFGLRRSVQSDVPAETGLLAAEIPSFALRIQSHYQPQEGYFTIVPGEVDINAELGIIHANVKSERRSVKEIVSLFSHVVPASGTTVCASR